MIIKMSKVEVIGPRDRLLAVLDAIRDTHTLQIDPEIQPRMGEGAEARLQPLTPDHAAVAERLAADELAGRIDCLLALLPAGVEPSAGPGAAEALASMPELVDTHLAACRDRTERRGALQAELDGVRRTQRFLAAVQSVAPTGEAAAGLDVVAVEVPDRTAIDRLSDYAAKLALGSEVKVAQTEDGTYIGLLTTEKSQAAKLRDTLRSEELPQAALPPYLEGLTLAEQLITSRDRREWLERQVADIDRELRDLSANWRAAYVEARHRLAERLALLKTSALAYTTDNCFVVFGWLPAGRVGRLRRALDERFGGAVVVIEKQILDRDLEMVPVLVRNPRYLQPFELFMSLLPLPRYTSIDPTPFIAIFFPIFFGMILGDIGYGLVLFASALALITLRPITIRRQAGQILAVCAIYAMLFGLLYGEFFGDAGARALGLTPWVDRREAFLPMLSFAIAVGAAHVLVGLVLGVVVAMRSRRHREAVTRLLTIAVLACLLGIAASLVLPFGAVLQRPLLIAVALMAPLLVVAGGLLAPFELIRHVGNIVSYARLMAVGLASVLLAYIANAIAGAVGSVWIGVAAAVVLHIFNIVLGVFAPTVHGLRLHYVEFFSKFFEGGGRPYRPLKEAK